MKRWLEMVVSSDSESSILHSSQPVILSLSKDQLPESVHVILSV